MIIRRGWRKSSYSTNTDNCVEVSSGLDGIRDSKEPDGPTLAIERDRFTVFVDRIKSGRFDR